jgi:hypothetical protein
MNIKTIVVGIIFALSLTCTGIQAAEKPTNQTVASESTVSTFTDFAALRTELLSMIGGSGKRVLLCTDFLTDADIVSSLYIAQYRKVDIKVLLGREKSTNILSRLNYLQQVNIQTSLRPRDFYPSFNTILLIDDRLITLNSNLDYMAKAKNLSVTTRPTTEIAAFDAAFLQAMSGQVAPPSTPLPQVGRHRPASQRNQTTPPRGTPIKTQGTVSQASEQDSTADTPTKQLETPPQKGAYRYTNVKDKPQNGIATKLPRTTITQERERERERQRASSAASTSEANTQSP